VWGGAGKMLMSVGRGREDVDPSFIYAFLFNREKSIYEPDSHDIAMNGTETSW
jgi:hypothetical protein